MKKLVLFIFAITLFGCDMPTNKPVFLEKAYFEDMYIERYWKDFDSDNKYHFDGDEPFSSVPYTDIEINGQTHRLRNQFKDGYALERVTALSPSFDILYFFQDKDKSCFLYAYSRENIKNLKQNAGFSLSSKDAVFLTERSGLRVISVSEYKQLKPAIRLKSFDPSLCKPSPIK